MKKLIITGASGFVGSVLKESLMQDNYEVISITRDQLNNIEELTKLINNSFAIINLAGASIIKPWTNKYKKTLFESRINTTKNLVHAIELCENKPEVFISTSAIGIYKDDKSYDETCSDYENDFLANLCKSWEKEALKAEAFIPRVCIFRYGIVLGKGGALAKMMTPFKMGLGGTIGDGKQSISFIHIVDLLNAYSHILNDISIKGVFNLTTPKPSTNYGLTKALGKALNRPTVIPVPKFLLKLILGDGADVLIKGQSVLPNALLQNNFIFEYEDIDACINSLT